MDDLKIFFYNQEQILNEINFVEETKKKEVLC
jgi:hypothetical protein